MRKQIAAGNWKMHTTIREGALLASELDTLLEKSPVKLDTGVILGVPFTHIGTISQIVDRKAICVAAQNCSSEEKGAFTGEVSAEMLKSAGCDAIILGHSERRAYYAESDEIIAKKIALTLKNGMKAIFCCGEVLEEREKENHFNIVKSQVENALFNFTAEEISQIIVAYEPVWAIGTGKTASAAQAQEMHEFIRKTLEAKFGKEVADNCSILYGGSVKPANAVEIFSMPDVDGGLVGGAALNAESFHAICAAF